MEIARCEAMIPYVPQRVSYFLPYLLTNLREMVEKAKKRNMRIIPTTSLSEGNILDAISLL